MRGVKSESVCGCRVDFVGVCTEYNLWFVGYYIMMVIRFIT